MSQRIKYICKNLTLPQVVLNQKESLKNESVFGIGVYFLYGIGFGLGA